MRVLRTAGEKNGLLGTGVLISKESGFRGTSGKQTTTKKRGPDGLRFWYILIDLQLHKAPQGLRVRC